MGIYHSVRRSTEEALTDREAIQKALDEDTARVPHRADARAAAVWAWVTAFDEAFSDIGGAANEIGVRRLLEGLHLYEQHRGPCPQHTIDEYANSWFAGVNTHYLEVYEKART